MAVFNFARTLILRYMTDYLEIAAAVAGLLFAFSKILDAATDPLMGEISDRTATAWGRRRPYLLVGAILCGIAYVLLFNVPSIESTALLTAYMAVVLAFYSIAYTLFNVPYIAMPVEMTSDYHARSFLMSFRSVGVGLGNLLGGVLGPLIIASYSSGMAGHQVMSWVLGGITFVLLLTCFAATGGAPFSASDKSRVRPTFEQLLTIFRNVPYLTLLIAKGFFFVGIAVLTTSSAYFTAHVLEAPDTMLALFFAAFFIGVAVSQPLWLRASKTWEKPTTYTVASVLLAIVNLTWLTAGSTEPLLIFSIRSLSVGLTMGGVMVMGNSMLPDTLEFDRRRNGVQREGLLAGFYTTLEKGGSALGIAIVGLTLSFVGYVESGADDSMRQSEGSIMAIRVCFSVVPAIAVLLSGVVMRFYSLTASSLQEMSAR